MSTMKIVNTTDGHHVGFEFDGDAEFITLPNGASIFIEERVPLSGGSTRFVNSSYIIEASEI